MGDLLRLGLCSSARSRCARGKNDESYRTDVGDGGTDGVVDEFRGKDGPNHEMPAMRGGAQDAT